MPILDHFGLIAPFYDRVISVGHVDKLVEVLGLPIEGALLDAGGGTGRVAQALRPHVGSLVIADESIGMLRQAKQKKGLALACSHTERLPFPDGYFERAIIIDAMHHVSNQTGTAAEMWRVLKPGGRLLVLEPDLRLVAVKLVAIAEKVALMRSRFLAPDRIAALFSYGNASVSIEQEGFNAWVLADKKGE